nr:aspartyl protease family protein [Sphingomonas sp. CROZ-RG-20F-R02-07]
MFICALFAITPSQAIAAQCHISKYVDIPVTMSGSKPIVTAQIEGHDARFILDSGAYYSTIAKATALEYGLSVHKAEGARLVGVGGDTSLGVALANKFSIAGVTLPHVAFGVGGSDMGYAGLLGQDILGIADVEYDLPHGFVRLMKGRDCKDQGMAYWAGSRPMTVVKLAAMQDGQRHTLGTISINGKTIQAMFDSGASSSLLTLAAARRIGVTPTTAGVETDGFATGLGQGRVRQWKARFDSIDIGGEAIAKPWIGIMDQSLGEPDMLIGIDFFLTHRIYVDNHNHRMFVTYEGGPVFGLKPRGAVDSKGMRLDLSDQTNGPTTALGFSQRGAIHLTHGENEKAIADFDRAVSLSPNEPQYLLQRAAAHFDSHRPLLGAADIDRALLLAPHNAEARLARARLRLDADDHAAALVDLKAADSALASSSDMRMRLAAMYGAADVPEAALANYEQWLHSHPEDSGRASAFNGRCWARALMNTSLDKAIEDCNAAVRLRPGEASYLDSRALVHLRRGEWNKALADYDAALAAEPREAWSLYARAIVERRLGRSAQADADRAKALSIDSHIEVRAKRYHIDA